jgi:hypothetical protein
LHIVGRGGRWFMALIGCDFFQSTPTEKYSI